jgi:hypothetical protein
MPNCASACATVSSTCASNNCAGFGFIFRGGDTWHLGNSAATPYSGGTYNVADGGTGGTSSHPIYIGVDQGWFSGGSWARPILTGDNPANSSQSLGSCTYPNVGSSDIFTDFSGSGFYIFDNFELTGMCQQTVGDHNTDHFINYGGMTGFMFIFNMYIHGWSHIAFAQPGNPIGSCTPSTICFEITAFGGSLNSGGPPDDVLYYDVVDGADSDAVAMQFCYCGFWTVAYSYFNRGSQTLTRDLHLFHDNTITNFTDNGHANLMESNGDHNSNNAVYNNVFSHIYINPTFTSNVFFWPEPAVSTTLYWFNNLTYDGGPGELFNIGQNSLSQGTIAIFNSTFQMNHRTDSGVNNFGCATGFTNPYANANIHFISDDVGSSFYASDCTGLGTDVTHLIMTNATATSDNYVSGGSYPFSPSSGSSPTVGTGTNEGTLNNAYCSALTTDSGSDSTLAGAATACQQGTTYAYTYNATNHTVTTKVLTPTARPASAAWDIGINQGLPGNSNTPPPAPALGLFAVVERLTNENQTPAAFDWTDLSRSLGAQPIPNSPGF